jgi:multiple sugar transport system substrate-binding protein
MRPYVYLVSALMGMTLATACVAAPSAQPTSAPSGAAYLAPLAANKQVSITFENYNLASAGIGRDATLKMLQEFGEQHPNIKVETKGTSSDNMFPSIQAEIAAGNPPDIA